MYNTSDMINKIYRIFTALNEHYKSIIDGDVLIDDKLETCQEWLIRGRVVCMPEQPWNTKLDLNSNCNQLSIFDDEDGDNMDIRWVGVLEYINKRFGLNLKIN